MLGRCGSFDPTLRGGDRESHARPGVVLFRLDRRTRVPPVSPIVPREMLSVSDDSRAVLEAIAYGGGRMPTELIERALDLFPNVGFTNAYGLTETSSTIALLGPDDHRAAHRSADPKVRARLGSVGKPLPTVEIEIRDEDGRADRSPGEFYSHIAPKKSHSRDEAPAALGWKNSGGSERASVSDPY